MSSLIPPDTIIGQILASGGITVPLFIAVIIGILSLGFYANFFHVDPDYVRKQAPRDPHLPPPTEVVSLRIYPIKSCRGVQVREANLKTTGLELDRNWMFVDAADMKFLTIRSDPTMTLINTDLDPWTSKLTISIAGTDEKVEIDTVPTQDWLKENTTLETVEIWGQNTDAWSYPDSINSVFCKYFKKPVKLVYKGPTKRIAGGNADPEMYGKGVPHMFADLMSVLIASESSMADLNARLDAADYKGEPLTIERFRPNIIVKGNAPWEEDRWKRVRITTIDHKRELLWRVGLDVVCRCARCQVPNVNPDTAEKHLTEPWKTLMKFRRIDQGGKAKWLPCFGMLCLPQAEGPIHVGAEFEVTEMTDKHLYGEASFADL